MVIGQIRLTWNEANHQVERRTQSSNGCFNGNSVEVT